MTIFRKKLSSNFYRSNLPGEPLKKEMNND